MIRSVKVLILAGGSGKRLWPLSTPSHPKQFLMIKPGLSLLQNTLFRFLQLVRRENLFILTNTCFEKLTRSQASSLDPLLAKQILLEPVQKNTGFAIAWALKTLENQGHIQQEDLILVSPSDHIFFSESAFLNELVLAIDWHPKNSIGSFGICPKAPSPEFGYIKPSQSINPFYKTTSGFIEKPIPSIAKKLLKDQWLCNMGLYLFTPATFWSATANVEGLSNDFTNHYASFPSLSIDHLLIEKISNLSVFEMQKTSWQDVGSLQTFTQCKDFFFAYKKYPDKTAP